MPQANGHKPPSPDEERRHRLHEGAQASPKEDLWNQDGSLRTEYIQTMCATDLQAGTADRLSNLVTRDWVLGFLKDAEMTELKWLVVELTLAELEAMHPPRESVFSGARREWLLDDPDAGLEPLSARERQAITKFLRGLFARLSRSRDGAQQEQFTKSVTVSEVRDGQESKDGFREALLGR